MLLLLALACSSSCPETALVLTDSGPESHRAYADASVVWMDWWTEGLCIDRVQVSPNAPLGGDAWSTDDGWHVTVLPEELPVGSLETQLCRSYAYDRLPLAIAPDDLFPAAPGRTRIDAFAAACAEGPTLRTYIDHEVSACRAAPLTPEEDFLASRVFTREPLTTAQDWDLEETGSLELIDYRQRVTTEVALADVPLDGPLWVQRGDHPDGQTQWFLHHDDLHDGYVRAGLPLDGEVFTIAADEEHIYVHGAPAGQYFSARTQWMIDRQTGELTERALGFDFDTLHSWSDSQMVRGEDWTVVASTQGEWGGRIGVVFDDGSERLHELVARAPATYAHLERLWVDPTSDHHLLATLRHQDYVVARSNPIFITGHYEDTVRIDVRTGGVEVLWTTADTLARPVERRLLGVLSDGAMVYAVASSTGDWLIGRDDRQGTLALSPTLCTSWSGARVVDDAIITDVYQGRQATRRWLRPR